MKLAGSRKIIAAGLLSLLFFRILVLEHYAYAQTLDSVSHIHHVKAVENKVLVLTHEGLYELVSKNKMNLVGKDKFDVMGFTTLGKALVASGHPSQGFEDAEPNWPC